MEKGWTELVFILDRSGSMSGLEKDTIGGFNSLLNRQKESEGECVVTTVLFDDRYELLHDRIPLRGITTLTEKDYFVRGSTALFDAIGKTIHKIALVQKHTVDAERAEKVLFVITTDGMENASREYDVYGIRQLIQRQKAQFGWEFLFLGANIDAIGTAETMGIQADYATNFVADAQGTELNYSALNDAVTHLRKNKSMKTDWKKSIEDDYNRRKK